MRLLKPENSSLSLKTRPLIKEVGHESYYILIDGTDISLFFKLDFPCSNDQSEFEALIIGLNSTL